MWPATANTDGRYLEIDQEESRSAARSGLQNNRQTTFHNGPKSNKCLANKKIGFGKGFAKFNNIILDLGVDVNGMLNLVPQCTVQAV